VTDIGCLVIIYLYDIVTCHYCQRYRPTKARCLGAGLPSMSIAQPIHGSVKCKLIDGLRPRGFFGDCAPKKWPFGQIMHAQSPKKQSSVLSSEFLNFRDHSRLRPPSCQKKFRVKYSGET
jgi:hypothetical protein